MSATGVTLPRRYYVDESIFRGEMERFYYNGWVRVGRTESIPNTGDYFLSNIVGESVIVTRDSGQDIHGFYNVCRHRGTRMCTQPEGSFAGRIQCPYHGWSYSLSGRLLGAPHMDESGFACEEYSLHRVHTAEWDGHLFLNLAAEPEPFLRRIENLRTKFAPWRMNELRIHRRIVYDVQANWKLIVLNFNECLHCPMLHPALNRLTDYLGADNEQPRPAYIGGCMGFRGGAETMSLDGKRRRDYLPGLGDEQRRIVAYYTIYPNFLLSLHPDYMMVHTIWPKRPDQTEIVCEWYFHPSEMAKAGFAADDAIEFWDMTNREDWAICEMSQAGISSRAYTPGPYSVREALLHAFDLVVTERK